MGKLSEMKHAPVPPTLEPVQSKRSIHSPTHDPFCPSYHCKMKVLTFLALVISLPFLACSKKTQAPPEQESGKPRTLLLSLRIEKKGNDYQVTIPNSRIIDAPFLDNEPGPVIYRENDFLCFIQDRDKKNLDTLIVSQPLHPRYEFPGEEGAIGSKQVELQDNEVLLRFAYSSRMTYLQVQVVEKNKQLKTLNTLKLPGN